MTITKQQAERVKTLVRALEFAEMNPDYAQRVEALDAYLATLTEPAADVQGACPSGTALSAPALRASAPIAGASRAEDGWFLPASALNDLMAASLTNLIAHATRGRWTNAVVRKDGKETTYEADWIKHMQPFYARGVEVTDASTLDALNRARGIDSPEGGETRSGSTAKPQEPGDGEASTRPEEVSRPEAVQVERQEVLEAYTADLVATLSSIAKEVGSEGVDPDGLLARVRKLRDLAVEHAALSHCASRHSPPQAQPLSEEEINGEISRIDADVSLSPILEVDDFTAGVRFAEKHHGITKGGNE